MKALKTRFFNTYYENGTVRHIKSGNIEIVRMIYAAVRDHNWGTIEPEITAEQITETENGFLINTRVLYFKSDIHFESDYTITAYDNRLIFEMTGRAHSTFNSNRTGICILHPVKECAGKNCRVLNTEGLWEELKFPEFISPHQPVKNIRKMNWHPSPEIRATLTFSGDIFEMEDQRNWTDASFKTYCRPLELPFPFEIREGTEIKQKIELEIITEPEIHTGEENIIELKIDKKRYFKLPEIGTCVTSRSEPVNSEEAEILKDFSFGHLRSEIKLHCTNWKTDFHKTINESALLEIPLFLVIYFSENYANEITGLKQAVSELQYRVKYIMVVAKNHLPDDQIFYIVYPVLKDLFPDAEIGTGVNAYFAELNRNRPYSKPADFISFAICPQVHAFDELTLVENLEAQQYVLESARNLFPGKPVFVSPVTLRQRFNVVATSDETILNPGELPSQVDPRQNSVFAAQWLLGSLKFLSQSGAKIITYFETVGWRGLIQESQNSPIREKFSAQKGDIFPVFKVLGELKNFDEVIYCESGAPLKTEALVLRHSQSGIMKILCFNFSGENQIVKTDSPEKITSVNNVITGEKIHAELNQFEIKAGSILKIDC